MGLSFSHIPFDWSRRLIIIHHSLHFVQYISYSTVVSWSYVCHLVLGFLSLSLRPKCSTVKTIQQQKVVYLPHRQVNYLPHVYLPHVYYPCSSLLPIPVELQCVSFEALVLDWQLPGFKATLKRLSKITWFTLESETYFPASSSLLQTGDLVVSGFSIKMNQLINLIWKGQFGSDSWNFDTIVSFSWMMIENQWMKCHIPVVPRRTVKYPAYIMPGAS